MLPVKRVLILLDSYQILWGATQNQWHPTPTPIEKKATKSLVLAQAC